MVVNQYDKLMSIKGESMFTLNFFVTFINLSSTSEIFYLHVQ